MKVLLILAVTLLGAGRVEVSAPHLNRAEVVVVSRVAERALAQAEDGLGLTVEHAVQLRLARSVSGLPPEDRRAFREWTLGVTRTHGYEVIVAADRLEPSPPDDLHGVLVHEFVHVLLGDLELRLSGGERRLPRWFHEGLAQFVAGSIFMSGSETVVWFRARTGRLIRWSQLDDAFPVDRGEARVAYAQSASFMRYLVRELGLPTILRTASDYLSGRAESLDVALFDLSWGDSYTHRTGDWVRELKEGRGLLFFLRDSCFEILIVLAIPLLAIVLYKRFRRERRAARRLEAWEDMLAERPSTPEESDE